MEPAGIKSVSAALMKAQAAFGKIELSKVNPHFKSRYADLTEIMSRVRKPLADNGLVLSHTCGMVDGKVNVITRLIHIESGEFLAAEVVMPLDKPNPQGVGSAITYGRRYGVSAVLAIVADEDDDGNGASPQKPTEPRQRTQDKEPPKTQQRPKNAPDEATDELTDVLEDFRDVFNRWKQSRGHAGMNINEIREYMLNEATKKGRAFDSEFIAECKAKTEEALNA